MFQYHLKVKPVFHLQKPQELLRLMRFQMLLDHFLRLLKAHQHVRGNIHQILQFLFFLCSREPTE